MGTVSKLLRLRNGRLPPSVNELGNLDPSRSSPEGHNQIRVSTPASFRRIGQRSSIRPVSSPPECPAPPQGIALRSLGAARAIVRVLGRCAWGHPYAVPSSRLTHFALFLALAVLFLVPPIRAALSMVSDYRGASLLAALAPRPP